MSVFRCGHMQEESVGAMPVRKLPGNMGQIRRGLRKPLSSLMRHMPTSKRIPIDSPLSIVTGE